MARRRRGYWSDWGSYRPAAPREAKGGIKAKSKRGAFGRSWWAKRWISVLEGFHIGKRLSRGRNYARRGQVTDIEVSHGRVTGSVQGTRARPYAVTIEVATLSDAEWADVAADIAREALLTAKLLAGEMPHEIEEVFTEAGLSLFPSRRDDLTTSCSCPDWSNPCKHIAAVYYLLGEEFDRDPFLAFRMRGMERQQLLALLAGSRDAAGGEEEELPEVPLPADAEEFWSGARLPPDWLGEVDPEGIAAALPRRLGGFPFWRADEPFLDALEPIYRAASQRGLELLAGTGWREEG